MYSGIAAGPDGKLYCSPFQAASALVINPVQGLAAAASLRRSVESKAFAPVVAELIKVHSKLALAR